MKRLERHDWSLKACKEQLLKFDQLLQSDLELGERAHILPFFRENRDLASFIGSYVTDISTADLIAFEYDLFGDFICDLAVGDSRSKAFLLVEFEAARPKSLFLAGRTRATPEWSPRLEHGVSQVIDWFWKLSDTEGSDDYEHRFGTKRAAIDGLVVVGRDQELEPREKARLWWRQYHTVINSKKVAVITYDQLLSRMKHRLQRYPVVP